MSQQQFINERMATIEAEVRELMDFRVEVKHDIRELQKTVWKAAGTFILINSVLTALITKLIAASVKLP